MRLDLSLPIKGLAGEDVLGMDGKPTTLGSALMFALLNPTMGEGELSGDEKFERWQLAARLKDGNGEVSIEEAAVLKRAAGYVFQPAVLGPVWTAMEQEARDHG